MKNKAYSQLLLLLLISIIPIIASWFLYVHHSRFQLTTLNHGTLINPAIPSKELPPIMGDIQKKWQIVYVPNDCCNYQSPCDKTTFALHQLRKALGKDSNRINLVLVVNQSCSLVQSHDFQKILFSDQQFTQLQKALGQRDEHFHDKKDVVVTNKIYLIDPIGNLFMYYSSTTDPMNILKDLQKVLEVSQIG